MIVLDSSVILKWIFDDEDGHRRAVIFRDAHISGGHEIAVPTLFFYEAANVLSTKADLNAADAADAFSLFLDFDFRVCDLQREEYHGAMAMAARCHTSVYDACYVALAEKLACDFITADRKLYERVKKLGFCRLL